MRPHNIDHKPIFLNVKKSIHKILTAKRQFLHKGYEFKYCCLQHPQGSHPFVNHLNRTKHQKENVVHYQINGTKKLFQKCVPNVKHTLYSDFTRSIEIMFDVHSSLCILYIYLFVSLSIVTILLCKNKLMFQSCLKRSK